MVNVRRSGPSMMGSVPWMVIIVSTLVVLAVIFFMDGINQADATLYATSLSSLVADTASSSVQSFSSIALTNRNSGQHALPGTDVAWDNHNDWRPLDCRQFLYEARFNETVEDPNDGILLSRLSKTKRPFWVSSHNKSFDRVRFQVYEFGYYYEKKLTEIFETILEESPPKARIVDVGGNIGWFSLLSAGMGHHVDVFEPNPVNLLRLCQSKWLNEWPTAVESEINSRTTKKSSFNIHPCGVGDKASTMTLRFTQPGEGTFAKLRGGGGKRVKDVPIITLDQMAQDLGWYETKPYIAILKLDIEGFEPQAVSGAKRFLSAGLVENILMELTGHDDNTQTVQMIRDLLDCGFVLYKVGNYLGPANDPPEDLPLDSKELLPQALVDKFTPKYMNQKNLWWKYKRG